MYAFIILGCAIWGFAHYFRMGLDYTYNPSIGSYIKISIVSLGISLISALVGFCISVLIGIFGSMVATAVAETEEVKSYEKPIYSLQDSMGVNGKFYLGRGTIESELRYYFLVEEERGEKITSASADVTYIRRDGEKYVECYEIQFKSDFLRENFVNFGESYYYILHVPQDTIEIDNYQIDLQ